MNWTLVIIAWWGIAGSASTTSTEIPMYKQHACVAAAKAMKDKFRHHHMYCVSGITGEVITIE